MVSKVEVIEIIQEGFGGNPYPGDAFLQGSFEGCEPYEEVGAFKGMTDWTTLGSDMLDNHYTALSFFSEAGFRFYLPAFLIADLKDELQTADPLFHLIGGFSTVSVKVPVESRLFTRRCGGEVLLNPKRYGAISFQDYARFRLSVFTKEEARAIVAYLYYIRGRDTHHIHRDAIDSALKSFWLEREKNAPSRDHLRKHLQEEDAFMAGISDKCTDIR